MMKPRVIHMVNLTKYHYATTDTKPPSTPVSNGNGNANGNANSNHTHNSSSNSNGSSYHHHRAPRTPESYFNVPESIALLNIVKSERIQSAFQSNRKNHASVWEMVAEVLNRFSARKRSAKQCCNRYENLKKIYTQLKKNPERHVRRNWPYMFLFKEIEEQRGECWGSANGKRLALIAKSHKELSYYQRRRQAAELGVAYLGKEAAAVMQHSLLQSLSTDSSSNNSKMERFLPNHFVEAQLGDGLGGGMGLYDDGPPMHLPGGASAAAAAAAAAAAVAMNAAMQKEQEMRESAANECVGSMENGNCSAAPHAPELNGALPLNGDAEIPNGVGGATGGGGVGVGVGSVSGMLVPHATNGIKDVLRTHFDKECNSGGPMALTNGENNISMKSEPMSDGEFNPDDIQLMQTNYNGSQNYYPHSIDHNILHPDVIVDTDNISDCSSVIGGDGIGGSAKSKRKLSTSTDGGDSTNYELIEYLKRREKRDEELLRRMDAREERLLALFERTVVAIEALAGKKPVESK
uniref:Myb/SANT-like DNA-binding domain-containing protein n=1 Tax=Bactrocera latifrons TaxID=174628 RepID=A0A0K8UP79_BACLA